MECWRSGRRSSIMFSESPRGRMRRPEESRDQPDLEGHLETYPLHGSVHCGPRGRSRAIHPPRRHPRGPATKERTSLPSPTHTETYSTSLTGGRRKPRETGVEAHSEPLVPFPEFRRASLGRLYSGPARRRGTACQSVMGESPTPHSRASASRMWLLLPNPRG